MRRSTRAENPDAARYVRGSARNPRRPSPAQSGLRGSETVREGVERNPPFPRHAGSRRAEDRVRVAPGQRRGRCVAVVGAAVAGVFAASFGPFAARGHSGPLARHPGRARTSLYSAKRTRPTRAAKSQQLGRISLPVPLCPLPPDELTS